MSKKRNLKQARRCKRERWSYEAQLLARAADLSNRMAPRPSQQVPTSGHWSAQ